MKKIIITCLVVVINAVCAAQPFNTKRMDSLFLLLEKNNKFMGSIVVSSNGRLLYSKAIGYADIEHSKMVDTQTKYRIGSISKMFTATLVFKAVEENKLLLSHTIENYFPQIENAKEITIESLLSHKSGIHDLTLDKNFMTYNTKPQSESQMIEIIAKGKSDFKPNSKVEYSNSNYILLSYILEKIYNKPYATILSTKIIKQLRLKNTYFGSIISIHNNESNSYHFSDTWEKSTETDTSIPMGAGSIVSNPVDVTTFITQLFNGKIISQPSLLKMKTMNEFHGIGVGMGLLEFKNFEKKSYGHNGAIDDFQSILSYSPEEKLTVAITANGASYSLDKIVLCTLSCYYGKPFKMPNFAVVSLTPEVVVLYEGKYTSTQIPIKINIIGKGNKLSAQVAGQAEFPLDATTTSSFRFEPAGLILEFDAAKKQMTLKQGGQEFLFNKQ